MIKLQDALTFVMLAQREIGAPYQTHVVLSNKMAVAFDGVIAAGHPIEEPIEATPHTHTLLQALKRAKGTLALTQLDNKKLQVKAGKLRVLVNCVELDTAPLQPDRKIAELSERFVECLSIVAPLVVENSQRVVLASALLRSGSVASTTGHFALEAWHGFDMPDMVVPKLFLNAVAAVNKKPVGFGFSPTSFTLHYEDGAWLRTQLYSDKWPDIDRVLNHPYNAVPVPEEFFPAIETIKEFSSDDRVRIRPGRVQSHQSSEIGATLEVEGLDGNLTLPIKHMKYLSKIVKYIDIVGNNGITLLYGDGVRGAISQFKE